MPRSQGRLTRSGRIPLGVFEDADLNSIRSLDLVFDQPAQGLLLVSDAELITR